MDIADKDIAKRVRSAKTWLEKAEQSFDNQSDIKGELNLMLAEAEMKNLRKNHAVGQKLLKVSAVLTAVVVAATFWYASGLRGKAEPAVPLAAAGNSTVSENPQWVKTPLLKYDTSSRMDSAVVSGTQADAVQPAHQTELERNDVVQRTTEAAPAPAGEIETAVQTSAGSHQNIMSDRQVQAAVQDARHSLRGK